MRGPVAEWLMAAAGLAAAAIDVIAVILIVFGTGEAFIRGAREVLGPGSGYERREIELRLDRWLIAGLTFLLAADIIRTTLAPTWEDIGRVAAIAAIRTFLNYFLERDMKALLSRQREGPGRAGPP